MELEWHEKKRISNLRKHGIDFFDAIGIWDDAVLDPAASRVVAGELRHLAIGILRPPAEASEIVVAVVYVARDGRHRIISARKEHSSERSRYRAAFAAD